MPMGFCEGKGNSRYFEIRLSMVYKHIMPRKTVKGWGKGGTKGGIDMQSTQIQK